MKIKTAIQYYFTIPSLIVLSSCSAYYLPNTQNVPLFQEKNEASLMVGLEAGNLSSGLDLQAAYAVSDHLAVVANGFFGSVAQNDIAFNNYVLSGTSGSVPYNTVEIGAGYFTKLEPSSRGVFEIYGGWGIGGTEYTNPDFRDYFRFNHFFIQPNIGGRMGGIDLAFSSRFNFAVWEDFNEFYFEPALTFRFGWRKFKFQMQFLASLPASEQFGDFDGAESFHSSYSMYFPIDFNSKKR